MVSDGSTSANDPRSMSLTRAKSRGFERVGMLGMRRGNPFNRPTDTILYFGSPGLTVEANHVRQLRSLLNSNHHLVEFSHGFFSRARVPSRRDLVATTQTT